MHQVICTLIAAVALIASVKCEDLIKKDNLNNTNNFNYSLSARNSNNDQRTLIRDIVERLHKLDDDIGKIVINNISSAMYSPTAEEITYEDTTKNGEKFSEVLTDLDSLQDEVGNLVKNATKTRQYNILVRLRPLSTILYRIRHNLHLMRNSLVAINTVSSLEKIGNSVLDSTLQVFLRPDGTSGDEIKEPDSFDINLDKPEDFIPMLPQNIAPTFSTSTPSTPPPPPSSTMTTTLQPAPYQASTTISQKPQTLTPRIQMTQKTTTTSQAPPSTSTTTLPPPSSTRRRNNNRRRTTTTTTTTTTAAPSTNGPMRIRVNSVPTSRTPIVLNDTPLSGYDRKPARVRPNMEIADQA